MSLLLSQNYLPFRITQIWVISICMLILLKTINRNTIFFHHNEVWECVHVARACGKKIHSQFYDQNNQLMFSPRRLIFYKYFRSIIPDCWLKKKDFERRVLGDWLDIIYTYKVSFNFNSCFSCVICENFISCTFHVNWLVSRNREGIS